MKGNIAGLMQQAQKMQAEMQKAQEELANLEVTGEGVVVSTLFEEPKLVKSARVRNIDFQSGTVTLDSARP